MKENIEISFPQVLDGGCLQRQTRTLFYIHDNDQHPRRSYLSYQKINEEGFKIKNDSNRELYFLAIDNCIFDDFGLSHCDCAIFSTTEFYFLEIKNADGNQGRKRRKKAKEQLISTIQEFEKSGISFQNHDLGAIVYLVGKKVSPRTSAQDQEAAVMFEEQCGAKLLFVDEHKF